MENNDTIINTSFIIIAYNEARVIARCLDAILKQQNLHNYELIVVDDGSKDDTAKIVNKYSDNNPCIKLYSLLVNQGRGAARAAGVKIAQGKYFAFVDADIILPTNWFNICMSYMDRYDVVGGIAVPDGDACYVYNTFDLNPKIAAQGTKITGNNGLYKKKIFNGFNFDTKLRDGEDVAFNHVMDEHNFKIHTINSLVVDHRESKTFAESRHWLYQSGLGAMRQLKQFKKIRLPDLAYFGFLTIFMVGVFSSFFWRSYLFLITPVLYILLTSIFHLKTKFIFHAHRVFNYAGAILVNSVLITCYYAGRTMGIFTVKIRSTSIKKTVMLYIDLEGKWGMPFLAEYDLIKTTHRLLNLLDKYGIRAVFFVVGKIIEEHPDLIKEISKRGHEIALHGYKHERLNKLTEEEMVTFGNNLSQVENVLENLVGKRPSGFRSPFLMSPIFHTPQLSYILKNHGYTWISNRSIRHERELLQPGKLPFIKLFMVNKIVRKLLFILLNWRFIATDTVNAMSCVRIFANFRWLLGGMPPFMRNGLVEVTAHAPIDCELVGLPHLDEPTAQALIDYAVDSLVNNVYEAKGTYNITFHDWIVGSSNRLQILERVLSTLLRGQNVKFILSDELI